MQAREHLFRNCPQWRAQQKMLWMEVRRDTGMGKNRAKMRDLFVDERYTRAILDFLRTTQVGRRVGRGDEREGSTEQEDDGGGSDLREGGG